MAVPRSTAADSERIRRFYDRSAGGYDRGMDFMDRLLFAPERIATCARAAGDTLEVGVGTGRNLPLYPAGVRLTGIDLSSAMPDLARARAEQLSRQVHLRQADAQTLPFADARFDTVVSALTLCTVPDCRRAAAEALRVLRSGGQFLLLEHVRSPIRPVRLMERLLNPLMERFEGDHLLRDPMDYLEDAGFRVERCQRSRWGIVEQVVARKP
jgi:ubiquinone/menaquinone biosynthesis C-methylase UbiE